MISHPLQSNKGQSKEKKDINIVTNGIGTWPQAKGTESSVNQS